MRRPIPRRRRPRLRRTEDYGASRSFFVPAARAGSLLRSYITKRRTRLGRLLQDEGGWAVSRHRWPRLGRRHLTQGSWIRLVSFFRRFGVLGRGSRPRARRPATVDHHHRARDEDSARIQIDEVPADLQGHRGASFDYQVHAGFEVDLHACVQGAVITHFLLQVRADLERHCPAYTDVVIARDLLVLVAFDLLQLVLFDNEMALPANGFVQVFLDADILILLSVDEDLLLALGVFKADFVESAPAFRTERLDGALGFFVRQRIGRGLHGVVDAAGDDRLIWIPLQEFDNHLLVHPRQPHGAPLLTRHQVRNADPAGAILVVFALAVPMKLHLDAAVLVGVDLFPRRADHHGGLGPLHDRFRNLARRPKGDILRNANDLVGIGLGRGLLARIERAHGCIVMHACENVSIVQIAPIVVRQAKTIAGGEGAAGAGAVRDEVRGFLLLHAQLSELLAIGFGGVCARIVVDLILGQAARTRYAVDVCHERSGRRFVIVVIESVLARPEFLLHIPLGDGIRLLLAAGASIVDDFRYTRAILMDGRRIPQHKGVLVLVVLEKVKNAVLFHQAGDEVEIGFAILNAILAGRVAALQRIFEVFEPQSLEDLGDDIGHRHLLKNAAIRGARQEPEPGNQFGAVMCKTIVTAALRETAQVAVEISQAAVAQVERDAGRLAYNVVKRDRAVLRQQLEIEAEQSRNGFLAHHTLEQENVFSQGGENRDEAALLRVSTHIGNLNYIRTIPLRRCRRGSTAPFRPPPCARATGGRYRAALCWSECCPRSARRSRLRCSAGRLRPLRRRRKSSRCDDSRTAAV